MFFLPRLYPVQEGIDRVHLVFNSLESCLDEEIMGKIVCQRHPQEKRGLVIHLHVFDSKFKFYLE